MTYKWRDWWGQSSINSTKWLKAFYLASGISLIINSKDSIQYLLKSQLPSAFKQFVKNYDIAF